MKFLDVPQSGSVAGVTSSRNRFGQYRKTRVIPVNPNTPYQVAARARLVEGSQAWGLLTEPQREAWRAFADGRTFTDSLGQSITLSGHQAYVSAYNLSTIVGETPLTLPPDPPTFDDLTVVWGTGEPTATTAALDITGGTTGALLMISATPCVNGGVTFWPRATYLETYTWATPGTKDVFSSWESRFGTPIINLKIRAVVQQVKDGLRGPAYVAEATVVSGA